MTDCIFCKIVAGDISAAKVYEDELIIAFLSINPVRPGHTLVVPKAHSVDLEEASNRDLQAVINKLALIGRAVKQATGASAFNFGSNVGAAAGQSVFHTHFHVIPRVENDGLVSWDEKTVVNFDELGQMADKIKAAVHILTN